MASQDRQEGIPVQHDSNRYRQVYLVACLNPYNVPDTKRRHHSDHTHDEDNHNMIYLAMNLEWKRVA
jgi:hypothetical protein